MAPDVDTAFERLDAYLEAGLSALNAPGVSIGITDSNRLLGVRAYGLADLAAATPLRLDHLFEIGSIGKSFTSILVLQCQERELLELGAPVTRYLPWFSVESAFEPITLHHLLSHTAAIIKGSDETAGAASEVWNLRHTQAMAPPGTYFHYSNTGYKVLGLILEAVLHRPYVEILRQGILGPLAMEATDPVISYRTREKLAVGHEAYYDDRPLPSGGRLQPAAWLETDTADGSIASTAADMCRFLRSLLNRGHGLLSEQSFDRLLQPVIRAGKEPGRGFYAYGVELKQVDGNRCLEHGGGMVGYRTRLLADLDAGLGLIILTNGPSNPETLVPYTLRLFRAAMAGEELPDPFRADDLYRVEGAEEYVGAYHSSTGSFSINSEQGRLFLELDGERASLEPCLPSGYLARHPTLEHFLLRFARSDGQIVEAYHGPEVYLREGSPEPVSPPAPPLAWHAFPGHYRSHNPWYSNFRVVLRRGTLFLIYPDGSEDPLVPQDDSTFRLGEDPQSPEFIRFGAVIEDRAHLAELSGGSYSRTFAP